MSKSKRSSSVIEESASDVVSVLIKTAADKVNNSNKIMSGMERWIGKVAIVTGASSGIGEAIAADLVKIGMIVVGLARRVEKIKENSLKLTNCKGKLHAVRCDMTKEEDIIKAFEWTSKHLGPVHVLINNAGGNPGTNLVEGDTKRWRQCFETNVIGLLVASREAIKIMRAKNVDGHIVNINSVLGHCDMYFPTINVYGATKHAVSNLNEILRQELMAYKSNIKVSSVSPGAVRTEFMTEENFPKELQEAMKDMQWLDGQDVSNAVMYVLSTPPNVHVGELTLRPPFSVC